MMTLTRTACIIGTDFLVVSYLATILEPKERISKNKMRASGANETHPLPFQWIRVRDHLPCSQHRQLVAQKSPISEPIRLRARSALGKKLRNAAMT